MAGRRTHERFKTLEVRPQESAAAFLARHGLRPGFSDPDRLPYYLLIVASPEEIPFSFQMGLGDTYAVGRLWFDNPQSYQTYAQRLVEFERRPGEPRRTLTFFGPANPDDNASQFIAYKLLMPLFERLKRDPATGMYPWWIRTGRPRSTSYVSSWRSDRSCWLPAGREQPSHPITPASASARAASSARIGPDRSSGKAS